MKNKCVGLDCEMCGNTKCPNEEKETIINGTNVSECEHHYTNTVNGIIYNGCAIYEQINELGYSQDTLCEQNPDCYFKQLARLQEENEKLKANKGRCAFKCLDNTFCDEAKIKIDKLELDKDCLNASLETARKYRGIAETDRDKYKQALEEIRKEYTNSIFYQCDKTEEECPCHNCIILGQLDRVQNIVKIIDEVLK